MTKSLRQKNKNSSGFTLVETLVAIAIFTTSILALMVVLTSGISNINYAKKKMTATYLAQEGIEYVRNMRDTSVLSNSTSQEGWESFKTDLISSLASESPSGIYPVGSDFSADFKRTIEANESFGDNEIKISSTVSWTQGSGNYNITFSENLFNWIE